MPVIGEKSSMPIRSMTQSSCRVIEISFAMSSGEAFHETINLHSTNETTESFLIIKSKDSLAKLSFSYCARDLASGKDSHEIFL